MSRDRDGDSCGRSLVLAYYLTGGYGSGHAPRALEVVRNLVATGHDVHVVTTAPELEGTNDIDPRRMHIRRVDQVVLDSVNLLLPGDAFSSKAASRSSILMREANWLESVGAVTVMVHPWTIDEVAADMGRPMGNVLLDYDDAVCSREDQSYAADMDEQMGNAFFHWEGLRGREQTPSPKARWKRRRSNSLPQSPTPTKGADQKRSSSTPPDLRERLPEPDSESDDMSEHIVPALMNHDVDSAGARAPIGAYGSAAASTNNSPSLHSTKVPFAPTGIFWDIENCRVPRGTKAQEVQIHIRNALSTIPDVDWTAAIQSYGRPAKSTVEGLQSSGVIHFGNTSKKKNSADMLIVAHLFKFTQDHQPPAFILLITGDGDFTPTVEVLESYGYTFLIALPPEGKTSPSLFGAGRYTFDWECMARGEGIVPRAPVPGNIQALKAEMIQLYQSKDGPIDMGCIPSEYNKMFNKQLKLATYNENKLVDLFEKMGHPFSIVEKSIFFARTTSLSATAICHAMEPPTSASAVPPDVVDLKNHLSMDPLNPKERDTQDAIPSVRRNRWDETPTPGQGEDS